MHSICLHKIYILFLKKCSVLFKRTLPYSRNEEYQSIRERKWPCHTVLQLTPPSILQWNMRKSPSLFQRRWKLPSLPLHPITFGLVRVSTACRQHRSDHGSKISKNSRGRLTLVGSPYKPICLSRNLISKNRSMIGWSRSSGLTCLSQRRTLFPRQSLWTTV